MPLNIVPRRPHSLIDQIVRVNHAVKRATESFSAGQRIIQEKKDENTLINVDHYSKAVSAKFERMIFEKRVRPSFLSPLLDTASFALGIGSCLVGDKVTSVCKLSVLNFVEENCNRQLRELLNSSLKENDLLNVISLLRDEVGNEGNTLQLSQNQDPTIEVIAKLIQTGCYFTTNILRSV